MVKFIQILDDIAKTIDEFLKKESCSSCQCKFNDESEIEWEWKQKFLHQVAFKIKCINCNNFNKKNLNF